MSRNEMDVRFSALSRNEALGRTVAAAFAAQLDPTVEEITDIRTAVSEAVTNAIIHGYENRGGTVYMACRIEGRMFEVTVRDEGKGIADVALAMQPFYTSLPELERSGMGFSVMEAFMDDVSVTSRVGEGTSVTLRKYIAEAGDV